MTRLPPALRPWWPQAKRGYTAGTALLARATMRLSATRGGWLPRRVAPTIADALAEPGAGVAHLVARGDVTLRTPPLGDPPAVPAFARQTRAEFAALQVLELPGGRVLGPQRAVVTAPGALVHDVVRYFGTTRGSEHPVFLHPFAGPPREVGGRLGVLASRGDANYYHFLHDVAPRLGVLERATGVAPVERWYVPARRSYQREILALLGVDAADVVDADVSPHVRAEQLVVPTLPDLDLGHPRWAVDFLRDRMLPADVELVPGRRIYVTRGDAPHTRIVRNEAQLLERLGARGFTVLDPSTISVAAQVRAFAEAELIVAPHGAALANLAFASPGASVIELFAPDYVQGCYWKLATCVPGLTYRYVVGDGRIRAGQHGWGVASDLDVDLDAVVIMIDSVTRPRVVPPVRAPRPRPRLVVQ